MIYLFKQTYFLNTDLHTYDVPFSERGVLCWLTTLTNAEHGLALPKVEFCGALCLRFGWQPVNLPCTCICRKSSCVEHAFSCPWSGFPSISYNEVRNLTAGLLGEVCCDVGNEPTLQPLECEPHCFATAVREDSARLDAVARDSWGPNRQQVFLMLGCLIHLHAPIFVSRCYVNERNITQMMNVSRKWRERVFHHCYFQPLMASTIVSNSFNLFYLLCCLPYMIK